MWTIYGDLKLENFLSYLTLNTGMDNSNVNYKRCIKKLHEMCRMMLKGVTTADKLIPLMESGNQAFTSWFLASFPILDTKKEK